MRARPLSLRRGRLLPFIPTAQPAVTATTKLDLQWSFTVASTIGATGTTKLDLQWSYSVATTVTVATVTGDEQDAWTVPLEWSFLIDLEPADDVEGDP